jgi:polyisoprenoid-binding protein YceI
MQSVTISVDTTKIESDEGRRDNQMKTTGLETEKFRTATFTSSAAISLDADAENAKPVKSTVSGKLTLHGVTRDVQVPVNAQLRAGTLEVVGLVPIAMKDYGISPPEIAEFVKADDDGALEFKLMLTKG